MSVAIFAQGLANEWQQTAQGIMAMALAGFNQPQLPDPALCHESDDDSNEDAVHGA